MCGGEHFATESDKKLTEIAYSENLGKVSKRSSSPFTKMLKMNSLVELVLGESKLIFCCVGSRENHFGSVGRSVGKMIILSFRVGKPKNKNFDHRVKETCAIMSTQVAHETKRISLRRDSTTSSALHFCLLHISL